MQHSDFLDFLVLFDQAKRTDRIKAMMFVNKNGAAKPACFRFNFSIPNNQLIIKENYFSCMEGLASAKKNHPQSSHSSAVSCPRLVQQAKQQNL